MANARVDVTQEYLPKARRRHRRDRELGIFASQHVLDLCLASIQKDILYGERVCIVEQSIAVDNRIRIGTTVPDHPEQHAILVGFRRLGPNIARDAISAEHGDMAKQHRNCSIGISLQGVLEDDIPRRIDQHNAEQGFQIAAFDRNLAFDHLALGEKSDAADADAVGISGPYPQCCTQEGQHRPNQAPA